MNQAKLERTGDGRFQVVGAMTFETVVSLLDQSQTQFSQGAIIEVDLAQVSETDSAGLALLIEWLRWSRAHRGEVHLRNLPSQLVALARISEVDDMLEAEAPGASNSVQREAVG